MTFFPNTNPLTLLGDLRTAESINRIDLSAINGDSVLRNTHATAGSGTVTIGGGEHRLATTANGADSAELSSTERVRFDAGAQAVIALTGRRPVAPVGNQIFRAGAFDADNGFGLGEDSTGPFVFDRSGGTETKVYSPNWNVDTMDGTGPSGLAADFSQGAFLAIAFDCYCYGTINFILTVYNSDTGVNQQVVVHRLRKLGEVQTENPNVPIVVSLENGGTATAFDLFFGARSFRSFTPNRPALRYTGEYRLAETPSTTFVPSVSFRRKSAYGNRRVQVAGFDVISDADLLVQLRLDATLTGETFGTPSDYSATETAVESDNSATVVSGGEVIWESLVYGGSKSQEVGSSTALVNLDLPSTLPVTLCYRTVTGSATDVHTVLRVVEEW